MPIYAVFFVAVTCAVLYQAWEDRRNSLALLEEALRRFSIEGRPQGGQGDPRFGADGTAAGDLVEALSRMDVSTVPDSHLLAVLIAGATGREDALETAHHLLARTGGDLGRLTRPDVLQTRGVGPAARARLIASQELTRRRLARLEQGLADEKVLSPEQAARVIRRLSPDHSEALVVLALDRRRRPIGFRVVTIGTNGFTIVDPAQILREVLSFPRAAAFVMGHNHPSGNPSPSPQDIEVTRAVAQAAAHVRIPVLDHVVVTERSYTSLAQEGYIPSSGKHLGPLTNY